MEQLLKPLHDRLVAERLIKEDWTTVVKGLIALGAKNKTSDEDTITGFYGEPMSPELIDKIVEGEIRLNSIKARAKSFNIDRIVINFMRGNMFFMEVSRWIKKTAAFYWKSMPVPTAAMCYDIERDDFMMVYNPEFFASFLVDYGEEQGTKMVEAIFHHELYHFTLKHITIRRRSPPRVWNIATDAAINSLIRQSGGTLPEACIMPGTRWDAPPARIALRTGNGRRQLTPEEKQMQEGLSGLIGGWQPMLASDWYFNDLQQWLRENDKGKTFAGAADLFDGIDTHDLWDEIPEEARDAMKERAKNILKGAVRKADNEASGWGNIPAELQKELRAYVDDRVDWDAALRNFVGSFQRGASKRTFKRINRRAPYDHPGTKRTHLPNIAVAIDMSGSVDDEQLTIIFGVLGSLAKKVTFTVIPFDCVVHEKDIFEWKKGTSPLPKRVASGGTDFRVVSDYVNDSSNGKFDGLVICTDGEAGDPGHSRVRRAYVITPNHKLYFATTDLVIEMDEKRAGKNDAIR